MAGKTKDKWLSEQDKAEIKRLRSEGVPYSVITRKFGVGKQRIWEIADKREAPLARLPLPELPPDYNGNKICEVDLFRVVNLINSTIYRNRPVVPPLESSVIVPLPAWAALRIARGLYDHGIIDGEQYEAWLDDNTPRKERKDD